MRDIWLSQLNDDQVGIIKVDVPYFMCRATLDIIGLAGQDTLAIKPSTNNNQHRLWLRVRLAAVEGR